MCLQLPYASVRPKTNRVSRHMQMRHLKMNELKIHPLKTSKTCSRLLKSVPNLSCFLVWRTKDFKSLVQNFLLTQQLSTKLGGARRDRTADLLRARQALSQLSYGPSVNPARLFFGGQGGVSRRIACYASGAPTPHSGKWWVWEDLNFRPHPYQGCALTN